MTEFHWFMSGAFFGAMIQTLAIQIVSSVRKAKRRK